RRDDDPKPRTFADNRAYRNFVPESIRRTAGDPQPQSEALLHRVKLLKLTKDRLDFVCRNPAATVVDLDPHFVGAAPATNQNAAVICVLHGVADKVVQDRQKHPRVTLDLCTTWADAQPKTFLACPGRPLLHDLLQKAVHGNGFELRSKRTIVHTRCF